MRRGLRPACVASKALAITASATNDWGRTLAAVGDELRKEQWRCANARVVIADQWARYAVVPWSAALANDEERLAHGRLILQDIYGDEMTDWTFASSDSSYRRAQVVCAIPMPLLAELQAVLAEAALRLLSLQPHLVTAFNRWRLRVPEAGGWFVTIDSGLLTAVRLAGKTWQEVHTVRFRTDWQDDLRRLLTLGRLAGGGGDGGSVLVDSSVRMRHIAAEKNAGLEWLEPDDRARGTLEMLARAKELPA
jgi:hypothetical protein